MPRLFGTDGIRSKAGSFPLDAATVRNIGYSLASHLGKHIQGRPPFIVTGRDTRESGEWIEHALIAGATAAGAQCNSAGMITTPGVAFLTRALPADAGIVISASHNPYEDNGIKIFEPSGKKLGDATERLIEADILQGANKNAKELLSPSPEPFNNKQKDSELRDLYREYLAEVIARNLSLEGLSLVIDCANGAASDFAPALFMKLGASVIAINSMPDGRNINRDCGSLYIEGLRQRTVEERADLGVAFDGDADRALFVDRMGRLVDGDGTLWVLAKYLHERALLNDNTVIATVMSNIGLEIALRDLDITLVRTDVGDKYVLDELMRRGATIGGEQSGHIIFPRLSLAGDGMITTVCLLRAIRDSGSSLEELTEGFRAFPQVLINVAVREKRPFEEVPAIADLARQTEELLGDHGRLLLRYSGTESLARVMIEGANQRDIDAYAQALAEAIESVLGAP